LKQRWHRRVACATRVHCGLPVNFTTVSNEFDQTKQINQEKMGAPSNNDGSINQLMMENNRKPTYEKIN
jgi:hypothetical protein